MTANIFKYIFFKGSVHILVQISHIQYFIPSGPTDINSLASLGEKAIFKYFVVSDIHPEQL